MKRRQDIVLSIPQPCIQDWDKMTPTEQGRYCSSCNKTVVDFSNYTDKELANYFKLSIPWNWREYNSPEPLLVESVENSLLPPRI